MGQVRARCAPDSQTATLFVRGLPTAWGLRMMDLIPHVGVGPVRFGMKRDDVLSVFGSKQTWEHWMGGNLNDSLFYPGIILYFDRYNSHEPLAEGRLVQIETNTSFPGNLFGRRLTKLCHADVMENAGAYVVKTFPNGSVEVPALDMHFWFTPEGGLDLVRFAEHANAQQAAAGDA